MAKVIIAGGGIVGLATAYQLSRQGYEVTILDKESGPALHQTGRNSGVIHSGIYYKPGSAKARNCRAGRAQLLEFCDRHGVDYDLCGKVIVAREDFERPLMEELLNRADANGVDCELISRNRLTELEPHSGGVLAIHVRDAGIINYSRVCGVLLAETGGFVGNAKVTSVQERGGEVVVQTSAGDFVGDYFVNCAGLHSDRVCRSTGQSPGLKIVPFKGEYYKVVPEAEHLCRTLIYPVPDPRFPFLGVHLTRMIDGGVEVGPNAVLALGREAYGKTDFNLRDLLETLTYPGFLVLALKHAPMGLGEMWRSISKRAFVKELQKLCPEIREEHLVLAPSGIRAQALHWNGRLEDDFRILRQGRVVNVVNAPSPAATSSLAIGQEIASHIG